MTDWLDLESKFRAVDDPSSQLRADWSCQDSDGPEHWRVTGSTDRFSRGRFEALASLAGNALSGCPNFSDDLLQNTDPVHRWLNAVRHKTHYFTIGSGAPMVSPYITVRDGDETHTVLLGGIDRVCEASAVLCLQLAAEALNAQPKPDRVKVDELKPVRQSGSVQNREAAGQVDAYMKSHGMTQTVMAKRAGTTAKTLRKFLRTGKVRTSVFGGIAVAMATSKEKLLNPEQGD